MPRPRRARHSSSGSPSGSAAASSNRRRASSESAWSRRTKLSSIRPERLCAPSRPKPPASCVAVSPRGSSSSASGFPRVSAMIRSRTRSSRWNRTAEPSSARASPLRRPCTSSSGDVLELLAGLARGEHDADRLRQQAAGDERERQRRRVIQPLRVVDDAQQRTLLGRLRDQAQHRQPDQEPIRRGAGAQAEDDLERVALRRRKPLRADRASARTADAGWRRPAPSRTRPPPPARRSGPAPTRPGAPAAPSSRSRPRRAGPATGSRPGGRRRSARPAGRTRRPARGGSRIARTHSLPGSAPGG